jgi:hypothetical protein
LTRRITHLIEEQKNRSRLIRYRNMEVKRTQQDSHKSEAPTSKREEVFPLKPTQHREVTMPKVDKNQNGKRNTETKITWKKARKISKKRAKIEKLQKVP